MAYKIKQAKVRKKVYVLTTKEGRIKIVKAKNYILASKKMKVSPYELRTYGHIDKEMGKEKIVKEIIKEWQK
jgi:hypothetical protein